MTPLEKQLTRVEAMLRTLLDNMNPLMSFADVQRMLGYKSKTSVGTWLKERGIKRTGRGYRRVDVIAGAADQNE